MIEAIAPYSSSLLALSVLVLVVLLENFYAAFRHLVKGGGRAGVPPEPDYSNPVWRIVRSHANSLENLPPFAATVVVGSLVGVSAGLFNILAWVHVVARMLHWLIYTQDIGKVDQGPRTLAFAVGFFSNLGMIVMVVLAVL